MRRKEFRCQNRACGQSFQTDWRMQSMQCSTCGSDTTMTREFED